MKYYIKHEITVALKRKTTYYYVAGMIVLCLLANLSMIGFRMFYGLVDGSFGYNLIIFAEGCFIIPYYSTIVIADVIFGKEYPNPRIKTKATIGLGRAKLYFGKFFAQLILSACFLLAAIILFISITYLFMAADGTIDLWTISDFLNKALLAAPLWIAGVAIGNMYLFIFIKKKYAYIAFFTTIILIPRMIMLFAAEPFEFLPCIWLREILLTPRFSELQYMYTLNLTKILILSGIYAALSLVTGLVFFRRKEF